MMTRRVPAFAAFLLAAAMPLTAGTTVFTVVNTNDSGNGSLRAAIVNANNTPTPLIVFDIPDAGVHTIAPLSALPALTSSATIDGYTQPGSSPNTLSDGDDAVLLIEIDGSNLPSGVNALELQGSGSTVRGLVINRVGANVYGSGILAAGAGGHVIEGNFIGTDAAGASELANVTGIRLASGSNRVGGTVPAARNLVSGNAFEGLTLEAGTGNTIVGNFIGTDRGATAAIPNGSDGIYVVSSSSA